MAQDGSDFVSAMANLTSATPEATIGKLYELFGDITRMNPDSVVAAMQTVKTTATMKKIENEAAIKILIEALRVQMENLNISRAPGAHFWRFKAVYGGEIRYEFMKK